jgi:hypothetical protein
MRVEFTPRPGAVSHRRPVHVVPSIASQAVVRTERAIVISENFARAVQHVYDAGAVARNTNGGPASRLLDLMETMLRRRKGLPAWERADVEVTLNYLATAGQIELPAALSRAS